MERIEQKKSTHSEGVSTQKVCLNGHGEKRTEYPHRITLEMEDTN